MHVLSRRALLASAFVGFVRAQKKEIGSFDFSLLDESTVPAELFFVREHFPAPDVSLTGWKLSVSGAVAAPLGLSYDDLISMPLKSLPVTLECAENPVGGGLVSHAEWTGVSLGSLLERARPAPGARFVQLSGADGFSRAIPIEKAVHSDTLIASGINGHKLPGRHGFPVRAVVPGWYGMDSIKWLRNIELLDGEPPAQGYVRQTRSLLAGVRPGGAITSMNVNSAFSRPLDGAILVTRRFNVRGAAWAGGNKIQRVEVSVDGGKSWAQAHLESEPRVYAWVCWSLKWMPAAGEHELIVRAVDNKGREQPETRPRERADDYEFNSWQRIRVTVS